MPLQVLCRKDEYQLGGRGLQGIKPWLVAFLQLKDKTISTAQRGKSRVSLIVYPSHRFPAQNRHAIAARSMCVSHHFSRLVNSLDYCGGLYVVHLALSPPHGSKYLIDTKAKKHRASRPDRKSTRLNSSHSGESRMPSSA